MEIFQFCTALHFNNILREAFMKKDSKSAKKDKRFRVAIWPFLNCLLEIKCFGHFLAFFNVDKNNIF